MPDNWECTGGASTEAIARSLAHRSLYVETTSSPVLRSTLAEELQDCCGFIVVARRSGLPHAAEGALKLKELKYRWAEHYPPGELKHGPLALVSKGTPVVVFDNGNSKIATNIAEIKARGGRLVTIGSAGRTVNVVGSPHAPWGPRVHGAAADPRSHSGSLVGERRRLTTRHSESTSREGEVL